jgi:Xaa-Pro aminopeptidase
MPQNPGFSASGHCALVLTPDRAVLVTTSVEDTEGRISADEIRQSRYLPAEVAAAIKDCGLLGERIGLVGRDTLLAQSRDELVSALDGEVAFVPVDEVLEDLRAIKSDAELEMLRFAAQAGVRWMGASLDAIKEGATEADIVAAGLDRFVRDGGILYDVAMSSGPKVHFYWGSSSLPHWNAERTLESGDMVHIDLWGPVDYYFTDFARSTVVGTAPSDDQLGVLESSIGVVEAILAGVRPGTTFSELHKRGTDFIVAEGLVPTGGDDAENVKFADMFPGFGHLLGMGVESPMIMADEKREIRPGMVLAVEAFVGRPGVGASNFEHNVIVSDDGLEVLTEPSPARPWQNEA